MNANKPVLAAIGVLGLGAAGLVFAAETKKQMPDMKACHEHCMATSKLIRDASAAVSAAKDSGDEGRMRTALQQADKALSEMNTHIDTCMRMMGHMGMMGGMSGMSHGTQSGKAVDPVCGMAVDPKTASSATHEGVTYYFCSAEDRARVLKDPGSFVKKQPR